MTFRENLAVLREHWVLVLLTVALAMGASAAVWALRPVQYTASLTLYVSAQTADTAQTAAVAPAADGVLLVTRFRRTTRDQVAAAVAAISAVSVPLLGTVLNLSLIHI